MGEDVLEVSRLRVDRGEACVVEDLSLRLRKGECLAVLGRNGVGKSTTMLGIAGFLPVAAGEIRYDGAPITNLPSRKLSKLGVALVPQGRRVFSSLTVEENLRVPRSGARSRNSVLDDVYSLFPRLAERRRQRAGTLSGGEQQMLAIGRALMTSPRLLLLDEPTEGLAPVVIDTLVEAIASLKSSGVSMLLTEQRVAFALRLADSVCVISNRGRRVLDGPAHELTVDDLSQHVGVG